LFAGARAILLLAPLALSLAPAPTAASEPLRCECKKVSEKLRDYFAGRRIKEIAVGEVSNADPSRPSTSGPGIRQTLIEELERTELKVKLTADVGLIVSYRGRKVPLPGDRSVERLVVEIRFTAAFAADSTQEDILTYRVDDDEVTRQVLGLSAYTPPKPGNVRPPQTVLAFTKPQANLDGTVILAGPNAPFGLEVLVDDKPQAPTGEDGFGLVNLRRDQTYAVRLVNRSPIEVAVRLSIDGLNIFTFSELRQTEGPYKGAPLYDMVLIPPQESITIKGWHRDNTTSNKFTITEYAATAAAKMGKTTDLGTITATFCAAWEKAPPADEPDGSRAPGDAGTGVGAPTEQKYTAVQRTVGAVRGSVAVRYKVPPPSE
jgi:hypothetical protein